jgi:hypothetical protein
MKQIIFSILMILVCSLSAQEVISVTEEYVPYQDSLFTLKTTQVVSTGYEGIENVPLSLIPRLLIRRGYLANYSAATKTQ